MFDLAVPSLRNTAVTVSVSTALILLTLNDDMEVTFQTEFVVWPNAPNCPINPTAHAAMKQMTRECLYIIIIVSPF